MTRRDPASPAGASIGGHSPAAAVPKPQLVKAAVISERPGAGPPSRRVAGACAARTSSALLSRPKPGVPEREAGTMFRRKLTALDYHNPSGFNYKGEAGAAGPRAPHTPLADALRVAPRAPYPDPQRPCYPKRLQGRGPPGRVAPLLSAAPPLPRPAFRDPSPTPTWPSLLFCTW